MSVRGSTVPRKTIAGIVPVVGRSGAGAITVAAAKLNDVVNLSDGASIEVDGSPTYVTGPIFEKTVSQAGCIQQVSTANLTGKVYFVILSRPG